LIQVLPVADGGNPRDGAGIRTEGAAFVIAPFSEDGDANYKFRLEVELVNGSGAPVAADFIVEWDDAEYARFRRYLLLARGEAWERLPARTEGTRTMATVDVPPGRSRLCMHPPYGVDRLTAALDALPGSIFRKRCFGRSRHGRELLLVEAGRPEGRPLLIMARAHPYESVGSFMIDGMFAWLMAGSQAARDLLRGRRLAFLPMPNPDGVAEGRCKRTAGGLNINEAAGSGEPEGVALSALVRELRPRALFDMHGFMHNSDVFGASDAGRGEAVHRTLIGLPEVFDKKLRFHLSTEPEGGTANLGGMAEKELGTVRFDGAFSWYGRDAAHLRRLGAELLAAFAAQFWQPV
jgi:hypothetical protein